MARRAPCGEADRPCEASERRACVGGSRSGNRDHAEKSGVSPRRHACRYRERPPNIAKKRCAVALHAQVYVALLVAPQAGRGKRHELDESSLALPHACSTACPSQLDVSRSARKQRGHKLRRTTFSARDPPPPFFLPRNLRHFRRGSCRWTRLGLGSSRSLTTVTCGSATSPLRTWSSRRCRRTWTLSTGAFV